MRGSGPPQHTHTYTHTHARTLLFKIKFVILPNVIKKMVGDVVSQDLKIRVKLGKHLTRVITMIYSFLCVSYSPTIFLFKTARWRHKLRRHYLDAYNEVLNHCGFLAGWRNTDWQSWQHKWPNSTSVHEYNSTNVSFWHFWN